MKKIALAALLAVYSANSSGKALAQGHPTETPVVCNAKGNFPADGASSSFTRNSAHGGHVVLTLTKPANQCSFGHDGVAVGGRIDCAGLPANAFTCVVSGFPFGEPFFSIVVTVPGAGTQIFEQVPFDSAPVANGFFVRSNLSSLGLPAGTKFQSIYVWDDDGPINVTVDNFTVDGIPVSANLRTPFSLDCTGVNPPDCGSGSG
jgi:hypothetical protein